MARVFVQITDDDADQATVDAAGVRHLRARRLGPGDRFEAVVAPGDVRVAHIESITTNAANLRLGETVAVGNVDPRHPLILVCALADLGRFDTVVEKATELGASAIVPFRASRSQFGRLTAARRARWERLALAACEQCGRTQAPTIFDAVGFDGLEPFLPENTHRVVFDPSGKVPWNGDTPPASPVALFIGPEGGFTEGEITGLRDRGAEIRSLGPRVLRFETAAAAALAIAAVAPVRD